MPNLKQHTDASGAFATLGLGTVEAIRIKDTGEVEIPNLPAKLDADKNIVLGTSVNATGTAIDFTGIPSTAKRITVLFAGIMRNSTSAMVLSVGSSNGYGGSLYEGTVTAIAGNVTSATAMSGKIVLMGGDIVNSVTGKIYLERRANTQWIADFIIKVSAQQVNQGSCVAFLDGTLTQARLHLDGAGSFSAGAINISWE